MKHTPLEPNLLSIFRTLLIVELVLMVTNVVIHIRLGGFDEYKGCPFCLIAVAAAATAALLGYLSWSSLQARLGRFYLPVALIFAVFVALLVQHELVLSSNNPDEFVGSEGAWQIFLFLFFPLMLIAWQYDFRTVILYSFFTAGLEVLMMHFSDERQIFHQIAYQRSIFVRTIAFLVAGYVIVLIMRQQRQQRQALVEANQRLRHYAVTLEQLTTTQERNRMSRELHDTLAHTLSGLAVQLEAVRSLWRSAPERSYEMLEESLQATRSGLTETRKAIQALRASPIEDLGLPLALRNLAESAASRSGAALSLDIPANLEKLSPDVEQGIFRVAQEALENIVRHADAHLITVRLARQTSHLALSVTDNGQGFDPAQVDMAKHFGLKGLRERVEMLGGNLEITSRPGQGTTIHMALEQAP